MVEPKTENRRNEGLGIKEVGVLSAEGSMSVCAWTRLCVRANLQPIATLL